MKIMLSTLIAIFLLIGCGGGEEKTESANSDFQQKVAEKFGLTVFELENGIGPVKEKINLSAQIDEIKAKSGAEVFEIKCTQCHKIDERYTGPALREVSVTRSPEYILNMIMNPEEMTKRHPEAKKMLGMYANQMTYQNVTMEDAKNILEYLRSLKK